jgi:uncharacterized protein
MNPELAEKLARLEKSLVERQKVVVAFSGGADSTFLLYLARMVLGREKVIALHARTPWQSSSEVDHVQSLAALFNCRLRIVDINPLEWQEFVENPVDRCYYCKKRIYSHFIQHAEKEPTSWLLDGTNANDLHVFRPGLAAIEELGVVKPLADAGFSKNEVRLASREFHIPTWDRPSGSCLATRIKHGQRITFEKLALVRDLEDKLMEMGYDGCRARLSEDAVTVELLSSDLFDFIKQNSMHKLVSFAREKGMCKVYLDMEGRKKPASKGLFT